MRALDHALDAACSWAVSKPRRLAVIIALCILVPTLFEVPH